MIMYYTTSTSSNNDNSNIHNHDTNNANTHQQITTVLAATRGGARAMPRDSYDMGLHLLYVGALLV